MADVTVSLATSGKDAVINDFKAVESSGKQMGESLGKMGESFGSIATKLAGLATAFVSVHAAVHAFHAVMEKGGQLADFADQTGITEGKLVLLGRAFENNGMKAEDLGGVINKMQRVITEAGVEGSQAAEKIGRLGIKVSDLAAMSPDKQFETVAKAIAQIQDPTERAAASMEIFGKSGGRTLALFADFDGQILQAKTEVGSFADVMDENARGFDSIGDGIGAIGDKLTEFTAGVLSEAAPALQTLVDYFKTIDATSMGKEFSESLTRGIDIALSIFRDPGNLFMAFGDALVLAFKLAGNVLLNSVMYVFEWAGNYFGNILPNWGSLIKAEFTAAFGLAVSGFSSLLANVFESLAMVLPEKFAKPLSEASESLRKTSDEWSTKAAVGLAEAWDGISSAAEKATEQTQMATDDWFDAASSAASLKDHLDVAAEAGASVRNDMQESVNQARLITAEADAWEKATGLMADNLSGAADSFKKFTSMDTEALGLAASAGLGIGAAGSDPVGPIASPEDRKMAAARSRTEREAAARLGGGGSQQGVILPGEDLATGIFKNTQGFDIQQQADLLGASMEITGGLQARNANDYIKRMEDIGAFTAAARAKAAEMGRQRDVATGALQQAAQEKAANDFRDYAGIDSSMNRADQIQGLADKLWQDGAATLADAKEKAAQMLDEQTNKNKGPAGSSGTGGASGSGGEKAKPADPLSDIKKFVSDIYDYMKESLPQHALS